MAFSQIRRVGLTGGIGSGKSTVAMFMQELNVQIIDADALARISTQSGGVAIPAIREAFGPAVIGADGAMDRQRMRQMVFNNPSAKRTLESIIHPLVGEGIQTAADQAWQTGYRQVVIDIPLLVESVHWRRVLDTVIVVDCPVEEQIERVMKRSGLSRLEVQVIIDSQASRHRKLSCADAVVSNSRISLSQLAASVERLIQELGLSLRHPEIPA